VHNSASVTGALSPALGVDAHRGPKLTDTGPDGSNGLPERTGRTRSEHATTLLSRRPRGATLADMAPSADADADDGDGALVREVGFVQDAGPAMPAEWGE
jgi:hypothetical protein